MKKLTRRYKRVIRKIKCFLQRNKYEFLLFKPCYIIKKEEIPQELKDAYYLDGRD
jgi:hypothetical protein